MSRYELSAEADRDVVGIARHSVEQWGWRRAEAYVGELHKSLETLARFPGLGRSIERIRVGYFPFEHRSHVVFYRRSPTGILIVRVLHRRMRHEDHL